MAIITQNKNFALDIRTLNFSGLYDGDSYTETPTRFLINYGNGFKDEFRGTGFTYNATTLEPTGGTVHNYAGFYGSARLLAIDGMSIAAVRIVQAARTSSTGDDFVLVKTVLAGNDTFFGSNLADLLDGFAGHDTINGFSGNDILLGDTGNDTLLGGAGADGLAGEAGADKLIGGPGIDTIFGGAHNDVFVLNAGASAANRDVIKDFTNVSGNNDSFQLENAVMPKLGAGVHALSPGFFFAGAAAHDANDHIIYNRATGALIYDSNGNLAGGTAVIATLTTKPLLTSADFAVI